MKKTLMILGALLTVLVLGCATQAQPKVQSADCQTEDMVAEVLRPTPGAQVVYRLTHQDAQDYITKFNAIPPQSNWGGDVVTIWGAPGKSNYLQFVFKDSCVVSFGPVRKEIVAYLVGDRAKGVAF